MNKIKIIIILFLLSIIGTKSHSDKGIFIIYNVNNEIITNMDVRKESKYLIALNAQLKNLNEEKIFNISKESILRETIKRIELENYFDLETANPFVEDYIKNFYQRLDLKNEKEFEEYLQGSKLSSDFIRKKIQIEITWNKLIYDKFKNELKINEKKLRKEIESNKNKVDEKQYLLSEIVFEIDKQNDFAKKKNDINKSINEIGFKNSANIYSITDSSKFGGEIGWIREKELSNVFFNKINSLQIGEHTEPINTGSSFLILRVDDIKYEKKITDVKEEMNKKIQIETERQLQQYSKIYYNTVKINTNINEL